MQRSISEIIYCTRLNQELFLFLTMDKSSSDSSYGYMSSSPPPNEDNVKQVCFLDNEYRHRDFPI